MNNTLKLLPFSTLNSYELLQTLQSVKNRINNFVLKNKFREYIKKSFVHNLIENINCKYYTETELNEMQKQDKFDISILNMNIRSLDKHCGEFQTMFEQ